MSPSTFLILGVLFVLAIIAASGLIAYILIGGAAAAIGLGAEVYRRYSDGAANRVLEQAAADRVARFPAGYADQALVDRLDALERTVSSRRLVALEKAVAERLAAAAARDRRAS